MTPARSHRRSGSVVLLSGGMDSATCLGLALAVHPPVHALSVAYGQRHARELTAAKRLARYYRIRHHAVVTVPIGPWLASSLTDRHAALPTGRRSPSTIPSTYVPARNTILLALALGYAESHGLGHIYIGANAIDYSGYPDCRPEYFRAFTRLTRVATRRGVEQGESIRVEVPLLRRSKAAIVRLGERLGVPWRLTWSCYRGGARPCRKCDACRLRAQGFRAAGVSDPLDPD